MLHRVLSTGGILRTANLRSNNLFKYDILSQNSLKLVVIPNMVHNRNFNILNVWSSSDTALRGVSNNSAVLTVQDLLVNANNHLGLSWGSTIILTAVAVRICLLPLVVLVHKSAAKYERSMEEMGTRISCTVQKKVLQDAHKLNWNQKRVDQEYESIMNTEKDKLIEKNNCAPGRSFVLIVLQLPLWTTATGAIRNLINGYPMVDEFTVNVQSQLSSQSFLWLSDLVSIDQTHLLPITMLCCHLLNTMFNVKSRKETTGSWKAMLIIFSVFFSLYIFILAYTVFPSGVVLYWATSSFLGVIQNLALLNPTVKRLFGIPMLKNMRPKPHLFVFKRLKSWYKFLTY